MAPGQSAQGYADPLPAFFRCDAMQAGPRHRRHRRYRACQRRAPATGLCIRGRAQAQTCNRGDADAAKQLDERHRGGRHPYASVIPMALPSATASDAARTG
ncbi:acid phosphatase [Xanthomonas citri pv. glycines]|nr:acid phosphatase [Xanthomonas citri pv. glycines str. 8ra]QDR47290.1 acid phosphatase [Xanthomonas citri pv. glycines]QDS09271.1 acid phosphatase [Xanthomonas citri pv. glycines]QDS13673.1 acid phosphatase [Xanthomonas citri pv. glycines]QDS22316.1 acid phosphatase [Xanthomonas citri pv. glycines]